MTGTQQPGRHEIVGIVKDAHTEKLERIEPMFFQPFDGGLEPKLLLRKTDVARLREVGAIAARLDSRARVEVAPLSANLGSELAMSRRTGVLAGLLGSLALALTTVGMFGVFAYAVKRQTREIGVRMALGAQPADVVRLVLAGSARPVFVGLVVGLLGAFAAARLLRGLLFGLSPLDPIAHSGVAVLLALAALAASYVPASRATHVDPATALRYE